MLLPNSALVLTEIKAVIEYIYMYIKKFPSFLTMVISLKKYYNKHNE